MNAPALRRVEPPFANAPAPAAVALASGDPADLAHIARPSTALALWRRPVPVAVPPADLAGREPIRLEGDPDAAEAALVDALAEGGRRDWHAALAADAGALARRFAALARCAAVAVRLEAIEGDACHRFHADHVPVRLVTTYAGPGTEWTLAADPDPVVHRMAAGDVGLFKGRAAGPVGILHRSPPIAGSGVRRLVLVIDVAPDDDAAPPRPTA